MTIMRVWERCHADGSPWEVWAVAIVGGKVMTRWAAAGKQLVKGKELALKGATPSSKLAEKEREKELHKGYKFLGEKEVSPEGDISDVPVAPKQKPKGFFTLTATPAPAVWTNLTQAGYEVLHKPGIKEIRHGKHALLCTVEDIGAITIGANVSSLVPQTMLAMLYVASKAQGAVLVNSIGEPIKPVFDSLIEQFGQAAEAMRDTAERLGLVPKSLAKALKASSGLFAFGTLNPT